MSAEEVKSSSETTTEKPKQETTKQSHPLQLNPGWLKNVPVRIWSQLSPWYFLATTFAISAIIIFQNYSRRPGTTIWTDLMNGMPARGDLGLGRFEIYGVTFAFEYPYRLAEPKFWSSLTPWLCYIPHQFGQFYILTKARQAKARGDLEWTPSTEWNPYAWNMFRLNVFFVFVHYWQTYFFYDGIAATFSEISSTCSAMFFIASIND